MGRKPCCDKVGLKQGPWTTDEDRKLINFILINGQCCWRAVPKLAGLLRCGKSCRLRWINYLRPDLKRGLLSECEEKMVIDLHAKLGNRWSKIASNLSGRTDNEIKNHWNTHIKKKLKKMGIDPITHKPLPPNPTAPTNQQSSPPPSLPAQPIDETPQSKKTAFPKPVISEVATDEQSSPPLLQAQPVDETSQYENTVFLKPVISEVAKDEQVDGGQIDFCMDEVPLIEPHEILLPIDSNILPPLSSLSSTSSNNDVSTCDQSYVHEELDQSLTSIDQLCSSAFNSTDYNNVDSGFWVNDLDDDEFIANLNMLINDQYQTDKIIESDARFAPDLTHYSRMLMSDEWQL